MDRFLSFKSIYVKFVVIFVGILWFSSTIAFMFGFSLFKDNIIPRIEENLNAKAASIIAFHTEYNASPEELQALLSDSSVKVSVFYDIDDLTMLSAGEKAAVESGQIVGSARERRIKLPVTSFKLQNTYILLSTSPQRDMISFFRNIIGSILSMCALLGSILIAIAARMIVRPIKRLTDATKEVSKGNFDVKIPTRSSDEIGQLAENFNKMTDELKNIEYLRKDFISSVSHEFKTPMTSIQGFAKLLKDKDLTREQSGEYADIIISETGRLANLSNNLLKMSRLENQSIHEQYHVFSLDEQIRNVILLLEPKWSAKELELDLELKSTEYRGDKELLNQVWINLIDNAIKFSNPGGSLKISIKHEKENILVSISDSGIGIAVEHKDKVFEKFYKADKSRSMDGSGLGLPIVRKIIDLHQGKVYFESELGVGTTFTVMLKS